MRTLIILAFLFLASPVQAAWHLYLMPYNIVPNFDGVVAPFGEIRWDVRRYGSQGWALVAADVNNATDTALAAKPNITKIPDNLDQQIGGALGTVQSKMEAAKIPFGWVTSGMTYRTVLRVVCGMFTLLQRYREVSGNYGPVLTGSVTLDTTFGSLPLQARNNLITTANSLKLNTSGFTGASTLRQILKGVGDQFADRPFRLGGITI